MAKTRFKYTCKTCGERATKTPGTTGLGGWTCPNCGPGVKVKAVLQKGEA